MVKKLDRSMIGRRGMLAGMASLSLIGTCGKDVMASSSDTFFVPPEESPHQKTFMQWPVSRKVYRERYFLETVQQTIANIANTISDFEPVTILAGKDHHRAARKMLSGSVELWDIPTEDLWCRDSGPLFAKSANGELVVSHIQFNGWGNRQLHESDGRIAELVAKKLGIGMVSSGLRGEAGGIEQDGHGLLIAHESSWVHDNRNPGMSRFEIQERLLSAYGAKQLIWAPGLRDQDITDYHIDSLARFTGPGRVLMNLPDTPDSRDPFHQAALETHDILKAAGMEIDVIPEPVERRVKSYDFVASYANYYVCNGAVVAAQFGDRETDAIARDALRRHYPGRDVVMLDVDALGEIGGGIHCATQQMPS